MVLCLFDIFKANPIAHDLTTSDKGINWFERVSEEKDIVNMTSFSNYKDLLRFVKKRDFLFFNRL